MSLLHPCPRCRKLILIGQAYCDSCRPKIEQERADAVKAGMGRYNRTRRDPKVLAFYRSKAWKTTSRAKLDKDRMCEAKLEGCQGLASEVHHTIPISTPEGWERRLEWGLLKSVCTRCHNKLDAKWGKSREKKPTENGVVDLSEYSK